MRSFLAGLALGILACSAAMAQQQLPTTSRSEAQVNQLNRSMAIDGQNRAAAQQNQFEVNSLRNELSRPTAPQIGPLDQRLR